MTKTNTLPPGVLVDEDDLPKVMQFKWHIAGSGYVVSDQRKKNNYIRSGRNIRLHRFILDAEPDQIIDHINGDRLDNRRKNLRFCTTSQNLRNRGAPSNNTSGYKGVSYSNTHKLWRAYAMLDYKQYSFGWYKSKEEAIEAHRRNIEELHGEWTPKT